MITFCENWIGISLDEIRRKRKSNYKWIYYKYPLIEFGMTRDDCLWEIASLGWPKPSRSSCIICPQQKDSNWVDMKQNHIDDWNRAIEIEQQMRVNHPNVYLHRSLKPLNKPVKSPAA